MVILRRLWFVVCLFIPFIVADDVEDTPSPATPAEEESAPVSAPGEKHAFQAEVTRLMDIIINSLYTQKDVFCRELISNAVDALEKARFKSLEDPDVLLSNPDLEIRISSDEQAKTLTIEDSGIGMTKAELIDNLGTVAKSGTNNFLDAAKEGIADANFIGQFGVGFYSAFLVADKVTFTSKSNDDPEQHIWESSADASFTVKADPEGNTLKRGSRITLHLKEDAYEYLEESKLRDLSTRYSQFAPFPISVRVKKEVDAEIDDDDEGEEEGEKAEGDDVEVKDEDPEKKEPEKEVKKEIVFEWEQVNTQKAIWLRSKDDIKDEEYAEFYRAISKDYLEPLAKTHFSAEGEIEFKAILFVPKKAPFDMLDNYWTKKSEIKLYVRRVLVADKFDDLLPRYMNFIKGVVDSDDLPLNVSRDQLQQNKIMKVISKKLVRKILEMLKKMVKDEEEKKKKEAEEEKQEEGKEEEEKKKEEEEEKKEEENGEGEVKNKNYPDAPKDMKKEMEKDKAADKEGDFSKFWKEFGKNLKMGCYEDDSNRSKIAKLLKFETSKSEGKEITLEKYIEEIPESQDSIYYMSGDSIDVMRKSPSLQIFTKKKISVLMLTDHLDEPCIQKLADFEGKKFVSIQKADVKIEESKEEKKRYAKIVKMFEPLTTWWKDIISSASSGKGGKGVKGEATVPAGLQIEGVKISKRLVEAPCVVVTSQFGYSAQQEKIMRAQAFQKKDQMNMMAGRRTLEINPNHPVVQDLLAKIKEGKEEKGQAKETAIVLFQAAVLDSGYEISDPHHLVEKVYNLLSRELGVDPDAELKEVEVPDDEEEVEEEEEEDKKKGDDDSGEGEEDESDGGEKDNEEGKGKQNEEL